LSPKRERVLIFVSDSSTALCKSNRKGKLTKGDLAQEIDNVEEHLKIAAVDYANAMVDIIVWWAGNEISAGEPGNEIGYIKIVGKVDSELFQLLSSCVEKLELYDAFNASEDEHNRAVFTAFIHATISVSRAEWLAEKMAIAIKPLRRRFKHIEPDAGNPEATKVLREWHAQKEAIMSPKTAVKIKKEHSEITEEGKAWELPDVAKAEDITRLLTEAPTDKAIHGKVTYQPPSDVDLVDAGDYDVAPTRKTDRDEDDLRREMYIDHHSAPQGVATASGSPAQEYFYNGAKHRMLPINAQDIKGNQEVKFNHGCWTDVDKLLDSFNHCRQRRWGVRQLLRAAKADKKGRIRLLGIDVPMKETIGQELFPVRARIAQGHNAKLVSDEDADYLLATAWYSDLSAEEAEAKTIEYGVTVLSAADTPKRIYHRTSTSGLQSILKGGIVPEAKRSGRSHGYFSSYRFNDASTRAGCAPTCQWRSPSTL
ncbi:unnamed protein product, partial [Symbiodinium microadriaticum]